MFEPIVVLNKRAWAWLLYIYILILFLPGDIGSYFVPKTWMKVSSLFQKESNATINHRPFQPIYRYVSQMGEKAPGDSPASPNSWNLLILATRFSKTSPLWNCRFHLFHVHMHWPVCEAQYIPDSSFHFPWPCQCFGDQSPVEKKMVPDLCCIDEPGSF